LMPSYRLRTTSCKALPTMWVKESEIIELALGLGVVEGSAPQSTDIKGKVA
jgi:hypothetical protein